LDIQTNAANSMQVLTISKSLPGEMWGMVSLFNPAGYKNKLENFRAFSEGVRRQGLPLLVIECAFGEADFEVPAELCDLLVHRRTSTVMWQKERLLNIALEHLPPDCDKVVWLDADVIFDNDDWVEETARRLESYCVVQPYEAAHWLLEGETSVPPGRNVRGQGEGEWMPGMGAEMSRLEDWKAALNNYHLHGHCGYAWAIRREILDKHGFYDAQVLGNGDLVMAHAMYGNEDMWAGKHWQRTRITEAMLRHMEAWGRPFFEDVQASVYYTPGRLFHLWHGSKENRLYDQRLDILKNCDFDPSTDMVLEENGCWAWATNRPELHEWARTYFHSRREEDGQ